jgi:hypothetical protein
MATWTIATLERELADGGVTVAHWRCTEVDGDFSASSYGTVGFTPDPTASDYIAYDSLTEANVLGWVWESVGQDTVEAALTAKIEADKNPTSGSGVPW